MYYGTFQSQLACNFCLPIILGRSFTVGTGCVNPKAPSLDQRLPSCNLLLFSFDPRNYWSIWELKDLFFFLFFCFQYTKYRVNCGNYKINWPSVFVFFLILHVTSPQKNRKSDFGRAVKSSKFKEKHSLIFIREFIAQEILLK